MTQKEILRMLEVNAYLVYSNTLIGNPPAIIQSTHDFVTNLEIGCMVLETSTFYREGEADGNRLGRLLRIEEEGYDGQVYYIETLDGREYRWHNASFVRVFETVDHLRSLRQPPSLYAAQPHT